MRPALLALAAAAALAAAPREAAAQPAPPEGTPAAIVDLATVAGAASVGATWRFAEARLEGVAFRGPGRDGQPTGAPVRTLSIAPAAGAADFDDSSWEAVPPGELSRRRGKGRASFAWYRLAFTVPAELGGRSTAGATLVLDTAVDDYAEIWIDGEIPRALGQRGGTVVAGWNASNRVILARGVRPGARIRVAIFGMNGPISSPPTNFVWLRHARLELFPGGGGPVAWTPAEVNVEVERAGEAMERIAGPNPKLWKLADGIDYPDAGPILAADRSALRAAHGAGRALAFELRGDALLAPRDGPGPLPPARPAFDREGNRYDPAGRGIRVIAPDGRVEGLVVVPRSPVRAVAFGGEDGRSLFVAAADALYRFRAGIPGALPEGEPP